MRLLVTAVLLAVCWASAAAAKGNDATIERAKKLRKAGKALFDADDLDGAEKKFLEAIKLFPAYPVVHNELGVIAFRRKDYQKAEQYFLASLKYKKQNPSAWRNLAETYRRRKRHAQALDAFKRYLALKPADADGWWGLAKSAEQLKSHAAAIQAYQRYVDTEKRENQQKYVKRARARIVALQKQLKPKIVARKTPRKTPPRPKKKRVAKRISKPTVVQSPALTTGNLSAREALLLQAGDRLFAKGRYDEARQAYARVTKQYSSSTNALYRLGVSLAVLKRYDEAIATWYRALELRPGDRLVLDSITRAKIKQAWLKKQRPRPRFSRLLYQTTLVAIRKDVVTHQIAMAQLRVARLMRVSRRDARLFWLHGETALLLGEFDLAVRDFNMARALRPLWEFPSYALGELHLRKGDKQLALRFVKKYSASSTLKNLIERRHRALIKELTNKTTPAPEP